MISPQDTPGNTAPLAINEEDIPQELKALPQWVVWRREQRGDQWTKVPYVASSDPNLRAAKSNDPTTWRTYDEAGAAYRSNPQLAGIGFVFAKGGEFFGIDLDKCRDPETGILEPWAEEIVNRFRGTYAEGSQSGGGVHMIGRGRLPLEPEKTGRRRGKIEAYHSCRYFCMTGARLPEAAATIADCQAEVTAWFNETFADARETVENPGNDSQPQSATAPTNGAAQVAHSGVTLGFRGSDDQLIAKMLNPETGNSAKFARLWSGDASGYPSDSEADLALCSSLAFWTGPDAGRIDRLFRLSGRMREKWEGRAPYRDATISKALEGKTEFYGSGNGSAATATAGSVPVRIAVGPAVALEPGEPRQTRSGKVTATATVYVNGEKVGLVDVSMSSYSQTQARRTIAHFAGDGHDGEISVAIGRLLLDAEERLRVAVNSVAPNGKTVRDIVAENVPDVFRLTHRTERGAWSEALKREITRSEFTTYTPARLVDLCKLAIDTQRNQNGTVKETTVVRAIEMALRVLWSTLAEKLPIEQSEASSLGADSAAAEEFREKIIEAWVNTVTFEITVNREERFAVAADREEGEDNSTRCTETRAYRASLASRVLNTITDGSGGIRQGSSAIRETARERWTPVQNAFSAWYRLSSTADGEQLVRLAMHYRLLKQLKVALPGARNPTSFRRLGCHYGVFSDTSSVTGRLSGGGRICELSPEIVAEILAEPVEDAPESEESSASDSCGGE